MSFFSRSSSGYYHRCGNYGYNHYRRRGSFGNILSRIFSGSHSGRHHEPYPDLPIQGQPPAQQNTVICSKCNARIPAGSKFCLECGEKVAEALFCASCGEKLPPNAKFCSKCGAKI